MSVGFDIRREVAVRQILHRQEYISTWILEPAKELNKQVLVLQPPVRQHHVDRVSALSGLTSLRAIMVVSSRITSTALARISSLDNFFTARKSGKGLGWRCCR